MKTIKRLTKIFIIISMIIGGSSLAFAYNSDLKAIRDVKVYIDGVLFQTHEDLYNFNGTTLVPMRAFFEKLGVKVSWKKETQTVVASTNEKTIELTINHNTAKVNGEDKVLVVEPKLIIDTTYVPLRLIAESLMYEVDWDSTNKIISIIDIKTINELKQLKVYESSSFFKTDYIKMEIINNEMISIKGRTYLEKTNWLFKIDSIDRDNKTKITGPSIISQYKDIKSDNNMYEDTFTLKDKLKEGEYRISMYVEDNYHSGLLKGYYWGIPLKYEDGEIFFPVSPVYKNNYLKFMKSSVMKPENYLNIAINNESERKQIEDLANEIIKGAKSDYDKLLKVNNWVAQNIYYDWDSYRAGTYGRTDAYGTLKTRKSVCQGYAELTNALLRAVGIPSRLVRGHALGVGESEKYWNDVDDMNINHVWNEAFVDGRWVTLDTTWNSRNKYENGTFKKGIMSYGYFDPSLKVFSYTHKIIDI